MLPACIPTCNSHIIGHIIIFVVETALLVTSTTWSYFCWHFHAYVATLFINFRTTFHTTVSVEMLPPPIIPNMMCLASSLRCWLKNVVNILFIIIGSTALGGPWSPPYESLFTRKWRISDVLLGRAVGLIHKATRNFSLRIFSKENRAAFSVLLAVTLRGRESVRAEMLLIRVW